MRIIRNIKPNEKKRPLDFTDCTKHFNERKCRIERTGLGVGRVMAGFLVDKSHYMGLEEHYVTDTGIIVVRNHNTGKAVTVMVAREAQIKRYYNAIGLVAPLSVLQIARYNTKICHYNY